MSLEIDPEPIPHLRFLINALVDEAGASRSQAALAHLDQLPYYLRAAFYWGDLICRSLSDLHQHWSVPGDYPELRKVATELADPEAIWVTQMVRNDVAEPIFFAVDAYLFAARRAQASISTYISKTFRVSFSADIPSILSESNKRTSSLPNGFAKLCEITGLQAANG